MLDFKEQLLKAYLKGPDNHRIKSDITIVNDNHIKVSSILDRSAPYYIPKLEISDFEITGIDPSFSDCLLLSNVPVVLKSLDTNASVYKIDPSLLAIQKTGWPFYGRHGYESTKSNTIKKYLNIKYNESLNIYEFIPLDLELYKKWPTYSYKSIMTNKLLNSSRRNIMLYYFIKFTYSNNQLQQRINNVKATCLGRLNNSTTRLIKLFYTNPGLGEFKFTDCYLHSVREYNPYISLTIDFYKTKHKENIIPFDIQPKVDYINNSIMDNLLYKIYDVD